jgi:hypothetical protein
LKPIPLFGSGISSYSTLVTRQRRVNCMYDIRKDQDRAAIVAVNTPGATVFTTVGSSPIRGWRVVVDTLYVVAGTTLYRVTTAGAVTALASVPTAAQTVDMSDNTAQLMIVDGVAGYVYTFATSTMTTITDVNFPNGATSVDFLNGRFIVNKPATREFYVSNLLDGLTWTYLGLPVYGTKENASDNLVEVSVLNGTLVLWGNFSTEFWQDVGTTPLPYQRINGATQNWGLVAQNSHAKVGNTEMFLGASPDGGIKVIRLNGYAPVPVSDSDLEYIISNFSTVTDAVALVYSAYGHPVYQLTFPTANRSFAYDLATEMWHEAQTGPSATPVRHFANYGITFNKANYVSDATTGTIYLLDEDTYTDNGTVNLRELCTRHIRNAGNYVFLSQLMLDFEPGVGGTPTVSVSISRDNGVTFGTPKQKTLGAVGTRVVFNRLGSGRDMVAKISRTDAYKFVIAAGSAVVESADG